MTRDRIFGEHETPFGRWLRSKGHEGVLPSSSLVASDCDFIIHRYKMEVDGIGQRAVQALMFLEVKTRNADPSDSQRDTMWLNHLLCSDKRKKVNGRSVWHFGVSFLSLPGETPDDAPGARWGRFQKGGVIHWTHISSRQIEQLLHFDIDPDSFCARPFRRHHVTREVQVVERFPLGFQSETRIKHAS
jgi:hypothetical protein